MPAGTAGTTKLGRVDGLGRHRVVVAGVVPAARRLVDQPDAELADVDGGEDGPAERLGAARRPSVSVPLGTSTVISGPPAVTVAAPELAANVCQTHCVGIGAVVDDRDVAAGGNARDDEARRVAGLTVDGVVVAGVVPGAGRLVDQPDAELATGRDGRIERPAQILRAARRPCLDADGDGRGDRHPALGDGRRARTHPACRPDPLGRIGAVVDDGSVGTVRHVGNGERRRVDRLSRNGAVIAGVVPRAGRLVDQPDAELAVSDGDVHRPAEVLGCCRWPRPRCRWGR